MGGWQGTQWLCCCCRGGALAARQPALVRPLVPTPRAEAGFLFVGLRTSQGQGLVKGWNMATNQEYVLEGHTVSEVGRWSALQDATGHAGGEQSEGAWTRPACPPRAAQGQVLCLAAANGMLFSGGQDATIRVWKMDPATGAWACAAVLRADAGGHSAPVNCLLASGPFLFSADFMGNIKARTVEGGGGGVAAAWGWQRSHKPATLV